MATYTATVAPDNTTLATFSAWAQAIAAAFGAFGWTRGNDTGQVVWAATVLTFTQVTVSGGNSVYAFSGYTGPAPRVGMSIVITGFATGGNNVTATITAVSAGVSVTVATTTQANETHAGSGTTTALAAKPNVGTFVYEIWQTSDSVGFPVSVKFEYGTHASTATSPSLFATMGTGSNGSGGLVNPSTRCGQDHAAASATAYACHFSGDGGRFAMLMWHGQGSITKSYMYSFERSYDASGTATGAYYTMLYSNGSVPNAQQQTMLPSGAQTTQETGGFCAPIPKTATSGNVGSTTHLAPVFPLVGGLGNPLTNLMAFRATDFADNQEVYGTLYGVQHKYISLGLNSTQINSVGVASGYAVRYD